MRESHVDETGNLETARTGRVLVPTKTLMALRKRVSTLVREGSRENDVEHILKLERSLLLRETDNIAYSQATQDALSMAIGDLDAALETFEKLRDNPEAYKTLDRDHSRPKKRIGEVPRDQARDFFRSHRTRLRNFATGRTTESEEEMLKVRSYSLGVAERLYSALQHEVLGLAPAPQANAKPRPPPSKRT